MDIKVINLMTFISFNLKKQLLKSLKKLLLPVWIKVRMIQPICRKSSISIQVQWEKTPRDRNV